jgi:hypothetical protein
LTGWLLAASTPVARMPHRSFSLTPSSQSD